MGQSKVKRDSLRRTLLSRGSEWDFPASQWESDICAGLREEDIVVVPRASHSQLVWAQMLPNECHANARWYERNDQSGQWQAVVGWWVQWPNFVLHSVIKRGNQFICITPSSMNETEIPFIPDEDIIWIEDGDKYSAIKYGTEIGVGVRKYPAFTIAQNFIVRQRIIDGVDPFKAIYFTNKELDELKSQYIYEL